jgi:glutamate-5-semialdehyde dehydrogenase
LCKKSVPFGVIGIIYEARPNVSFDVFSLCFKTGNACVLRSGKEALNSSRAIVNAIRRALEKGGVDPDMVCLIDSADRESSRSLMEMRGLVDVLIPRGGKGLIQSVVNNARVPVIETGAGNCHLYVDESADIDMALKVAINAKMSRPSVCNAIETILVHEGVAKEFLTQFAAMTKDGDHPLEIRGDERCQEILGCSAASEEDYDTEYNDYIAAVRVVDSINEAIDHIIRYSTGHSEAIITKSLDAASLFKRDVDAAAVYVNASTRFTDGGCFGFGAEIGISTQKLHARGPMGLFELTTVKYLVEGDGQIR